MIKLFNINKIKSIITKPKIASFIGILLLLLVTYCVFEKEHCPLALKLNTYKYENNHQYIPVGQETSIPLKDDGDLYSCHSYNVRYRAVKSQSWINDWWAHEENNYIYIFQVHIDNNNHIYDIELLHQKQIQTDGVISIDKYFTLHDSKIGRKEFYLLALDSASEEWKNGYKSDGKKDFLKKIKSKASLSFSFYLKKNNSICSPKVNINYQYLPKEGNSKWMPLEDDDKLQIGDSIKINFKLYEDLYVYIFFLNDGKMDEFIAAFISNGQLKSRLLTRNKEYELPSSGTLRYEGDEKVYFIAMQYEDKMLEQYYTEKQYNQLIEYIETIDVSKSYINKRKLR
jgi:hypothetical protein